MQKTMTKIVSAGSAPDRLERPDFKGFSAPRPRKGPASIGVGGRERFQSSISGRKLRASWAGKM